MVNQNDDRKIESELRIVRRVAGEAGFDVTYLRRRRGAHLSGLLSNEKRLPLAEAAGYAQRS